MPSSRRWKKPEDFLKRLSSCPKGRGHHDPSPVFARDKGASHQIWRSRASAVRRSPGCVGCHEWRTGIIVDDPHALRPVPRLRRGVRGRQHDPRRRRPSGERRERRRLQADAPLRPRQRQLLPRLLGRRRRRPHERDKKDRHNPSEIRDGSRFQGRWTPTTRSPSAACRWPSPRRARAR